MINYDDNDNNSDNDDDNDNDDNDDNDNDDNDDNDDDDDDDNNNNDSDLLDHWWNDEHFVLFKIMSKFFFKNLNLLKFIFVRNVVSIKWYR